MFRESSLEWDSFYDKNFIFFIFLFFIIVNYSFGKQFKN